MTKIASFAAHILAICVVVALALVGTAMGEVSREGLVGEWHFDGDAKDSSGNGNDGQIFGATFVEGKLGQALSFDGLNDYVNLGNAANLDPGNTKTLTISAWVRRINPQSRILVAIKRSIGGYVLGVGILETSSPNQIKMTKYGVIDIYLGNFPEDTNWHYLVGVWNNEGVFVYIDGALNAKSTDTSNFRPSTSGDVLIGGDLGDQGYGRCLIDEVRIYNRALSAEEIKVNYEAGQTTTLTKPPAPTSIKQEQPATTPSEPASSAVLLHGEKTDVVLGEDVLLKLSAVNLITKPPMTVQVMIYPPSGMSVTSSEFVKSGAGIYTTTYSLNPGDGKDIEVRIKTNQVGDFNVKGRIVYYFGDNQSTAEDHTMNLPIKVRKESELAQNEKTPAQKTPGFGIIIGIGVVLFIFLKKRGIKE